MKINGLNLSHESYSSEEVKEKSLGKNSTEEEVQCYYNEIIKVNFNKYKEIIKQGPSKLETPEVKGLSTQLKKDFTIMILCHPNVCIKVEGNVFSQLWQYSYTKINTLRRTIDLLKKQNVDAAAVKKFIGNYVNILNKTSDFYTGFYKKVDDELTRLSAREETSSVQVFWGSVLYDCCIVRGDLVRYKERVISSSTKMKYVEAETFYTKAIALDPTEGQAYNQIGTIMIYRKKYLIAAANYVRAFMVNNPFTTAESNLAMLFKAQILGNKDRSDILAAISDLKTGPSAKVSPDSVLFYYLYLTAKMLKSINGVQPGMEIKEQEILDLKKGFNYLFFSGSASKEIIIALVVMTLYCMDQFRVKGSNMERVICLVDVLVEAAFMHISNRNALLLLSLLADFFSTNIEFSQLLNRNSWTIPDSVRSIADKAPINALTARFPLREELALHGFHPLREKVDHFVGQGRGIDYIKEPDSAPYRAQKIITFVDKMLYTEDGSKGRVELSPSCGSESDFDEEIILKPSGNVPQIATLIPNDIPLNDLAKGDCSFSMLLNDVPTSVGSDPNIDEQEGLVTGYNGDEDAIFRDEIPQNSDIAVPPGFGFV